MLRIWTTGLALLTILAGSTQARAEAPSAQAPLAENAALVYWQAFLFLPQLEEGQKSAVSDAVANLGPLSDDLLEIVKSAQTALEELRRGAKLPRCVWGINWEAGAEALLPHLSKAREMARLGCLRAIARFEQGQSSDAIDDLAAVMTLGRHVGSSGIMISVLVGYAIEDMALNVARGYLPALDPEDLRRLSNCLAALPPQTTARESVLAEKRAFGEWLVRELSKPDGKQTLLRLIGKSDDRLRTAVEARSREELTEGATELLHVYDRLADVTLLPQQEVRRAEKELLASLGAESAVAQLAKGLLPGAVAVRRNEAVRQARLAMLETGIALVQGDPAVLKRKELQDPFGDGPFQYRKLDGGFELRSKLLDRKDEPVTLVFGKKDAR